MHSVRRWLEDLGLGKYVETFEAAEIQVDVLPHLTEADLKDLGLPLGPRRRILSALATSASAPPPGQRSPIVSPGAVAHEPERRHLTVLFCDLVGSTELSQRHDPEDLRDIVRRYQDACAGVLARYGSGVAKFLGDGVLAYFGYPEAHEDEAERAVRAGLDMVDAVARLQADGRPLAARVGIATGLVVVGDIGGSGDANAVVGETPNLAARLQAEAPPGAVVIAPATRRLAGNWFSYEDMGARILKGIAEPVAVTRVIAAHSAESRFSAIRARRLTPFVGRLEEIALLSARWRMAKHGEGQVVLLSAEAGVGKSRIAEAIHDQVGDVGDPRLRYQCSPYHTSSALYPATEQLRVAASIVASDTADQRLAKLAAVVGEPSLPLLAELLGIPTSGRFAAPELAPDGQKTRTLMALVDQVLGLSERGTVFFLVEDAHWLDPTTRELLDRIVAAIPQRRILMLVTARPEFQNPWARHPHVTTLSLNRLGARDCTEMVAGLPGAASLPADVLATIVSRADGVPLFVEELTSSMVESGASHPDAIPVTLQDSLHARLGRLATAKPVAQIAAAVGRDFDYHLIARLADIAEPELVQSLEQLESAGLLFRRGVPPDARYAFKHALIRDAAYQSLLKSQQVRINARIVDVLEGGGFEQASAQPELIAHYATEAGDHDRAGRYWHQAGESSLRRSAVTEASEQFAHALTAIEAAKDHADARHRRQQTLSRLGIARMHSLGRSHPLVRQTFEEARDLARELNDDKARISPLVGLWAVNMLAGRVQECRQTVEEVFEVARATGDEGLLLQAHHAAWPVEFLSGSFAVAHRHLVQGLAIYDEVRHQDHRLLYFGHDPASCGLSCAAGVEWAMGRPETALRQEAKAIEHSRKIAHPTTLVHVLDLVGWTRAVRGDLSALDAAEEGLQLCERYHLPNYVPMCQIVHGWGLVKTGKSIDLGLREIATGVRSLQERGSVGRLASMMALQVDANLAVGQVQSCPPLMEQIFTLLDSSHERWAEVPIRLIHSRLMRCLGRDDDAKAACEAALRTAREQEALHWELIAATELVRLRAQVVSPVDLLRPIIDRFTEGHDCEAIRDARSLL